MFFVCFCFVFCARGSLVHSLFIFKSYVLSLSIHTYIYKFVNYVYFFQVQLAVEPVSFWLSPSFTNILNTLSRNRVKWVAWAHFSSNQKGCGWHFEDAWKDNRKYICGIHYIRMTGIYYIYEKLQSSVVVVVGTWKDYISCRLDLSFIFSLYNRYSWCPFIVSCIFQHTVEDFLKLFF